MPNFKTQLNELKKINPSIIYSFEPESTPERLAGIETCETSIIPEQNQRLDMLNGYLYVENHILPHLEKHAGTISSQELLTWFDELHRIMGNTLMKNLRSASGKYTEQLILRWHNGCAISDEIIFYFSGKHPIKKEKEFVNALVKQYGVEKKAMEGFINLLHKLEKNEAIEIPQWQLQFIQENAKRLPGILVLNKLAIACLEDKLTFEEKSCVDKILKICCYPHEIPHKMDALAQETAKKLKEVDTNSEDDMIQFLADFYYKFTEIHPYGNGNGRVAAAMLNAFLLYFKKPSLSLRLPGERSEENSDYNQAFKEIDKTRTALAELIKKRIHTEEQKPYSDELLLETIAARVDTALSMQEILRLDPKFNLQTLLDEANKNHTQTLKEMVPQFLSLLNHDVQIFDLYSLILSKKLFEITLKKEKELKLKHESVKNISFITSLNPEQKNKVLAGLYNLTECKEWKLTSKGDSAWIVLNDKKTAGMIQQKLMEAQIGTIAMGQIKGQEGVWSVQCRNIDVKKVIDASHATSGLNPSQTPALSKN